MKLLLVLLAMITVAVQETKKPAPPPIRNGSLPSVSPDGSHIAFISNRTGSDDLFVIASDGTSEVQLTNTTPQVINDGHSIAWMTRWSPDGKQISFTGRNDPQSDLAICFVLFVPFCG